jgi:hypothetical protein
MKSLHEALQALARGARLDALDTNADGFVELVFGDQMLSLYIKVADASQIELSTRIDAFGQGLTPELALALLDDNARRLRGRLAVDGTGAIVFGQRLDVADLDEKALLAAADAFLHDALRLEATGAAALKQSAEKYRTKAEMPQDAMIRL